MTALSLGFKLDTTELHNSRDYKTRRLTRMIRLLPLRNKLV